MWHCRTSVVVRFMLVLQFHKCHVWIVPVMFITNLIFIPMLILTTELERKQRAVSEIWQVHYHISFVDRYIIIWYCINYRHCVVFHHEGNLWKILPIRTVHVKLKSESILICAGSVAQWQVFVCLPWNHKSKSWVTSNPCYTRKSCHER